MKKFSSLSLLFLLTGCLTQNPIIELAPSAPTSLTVSPVSPSNDTTPTIRGVTSSDVAVVLYAAPGCMGSAVASGQAGNSGQFSLTSGELPTGSYNFSVRASNARGSICSSQTVAYNLTASPPVASVSKDPASPALIRSTDTVNFIVEYTDADEVNLTSTDILISDTGTVACADVTVTDGTTSTPHVTIGNCTGDGTFGIAVGAGTATNLAGSSLASNLSSTVTVDNTGISTATFDPPAGTYKTMPSSLEITFPEAFSGLGVGDFAINGTCSIKPNITLLQTTSSTGTITLSAPTCAAGETVEITLNFAGIEDGAGNVGTGQLVTTYTIDAVGPTSATFNPGTGSINAIPGSIDVTFSEDINSDSLFDTSFQVSGDCVAKPEVTLGEASGATVPITLSGGNCVHGNELTITIDLKSVEDAMGSPGSGTTIVQYIFDTVQPTPTSITPLDGTVGSVPTTVTVNFDEVIDIASISDNELKISGDCSVDVTPKLISEDSGTTMEFELLGLSCTTHGHSLTVTLDGVDIKDSAGNSGTSQISATYIVDKNGPSVDSVSHAPGKVNGIPTPITFTFTESLEEGSVSIDDFTLSGSCDYLPNSLSVSDKTGNTVEISLSSVTCDEGENLNISVELTGIKDIYDNFGESSHTITYTQDGVKPLVQSFTLNTTVTPFVGTLTFNEDIKAPVELSDFDVSSNLCSSVDLENFQVSSAVVTFDLTASCDPTGEVIVTLKEGSVEDEAGNTSSGTPSVIYTAPP